MSVTTDHVLTQHWYAMETVTVEAHVKMKNPVLQQRVNCAQTPKNGIRVPMITQEHVLT